jgi:hypothetical protein
VLDLEDDLAVAGAGAGHGRDSSWMRGGLVWWGMSWRVSASALLLLGWAWPTLMPGCWISTPSFVDILWTRFGLQNKTRSFLNDDHYANCCGNLMKLLTCTKVDTLEYTMV